MTFSEKKQAGLLGNAIVVEGNHVAASYSDLQSALEDHTKRPGYSHANVYVRHT